MKGGDSALQFLRKNEQISTEICSRFLTQARMEYLRDRLDYDVRSEFGNFPVLTELWLTEFNCDHIRLIEFYESSFEVRDYPRHEALMEVFMVTLVATIVGGIAVE